MPGRRGEDSHIKRGGLLVVSLRGVNLGFWSHLGCFGQNVYIYTFIFQHEVKVSLPSLKVAVFFLFFCVMDNMVSFRGQKMPGPRPDWSPLRV